MGLTRCLRTLLFLVCLPLTVSQALAEHGYVSTGLKILTLDTTSGALGPFASTPDPVGELALDPTGLTFPQ